MSENGFRIGKEEKKLAPVPKGFKVVLAGVLVLVAVAAGLHFL